MMRSTREAEIKEEENKGVWQEAAGCCMCAAWDTVMCVPIKKCCRAVTPVSRRTGEINCELVVNRPAGDSEL